MDTAFWSFLAVVVFVLLLWYVGAFSKAFNVLDTHSQDVVQSLESSATLRRKAESLLSDQRMRKDGIAVQVSSIMRSADAEASVVATEGAQAVNHMIERSVRSIEAKVFVLEERAKKVALVEIAEKGKLVAIELMRHDLLEGALGSKIIMRDIDLIKEKLN